MRRRECLTLLAGVTLAWPLAARALLQPTKFDVVINTKTAKAFVIVIPSGVLAIADEVIESQFAAMHESGAARGTNVRPT